MKIKADSRKAIALALLLCFMVFPLLSEVYVLSHSGHEHSHFQVDDGCTICIHLHSAHYRLKQLGQAALDSSMAYVAFSLAIIVSFYAIYNLFYAFSPITQKIRLDN